MQKQKLVWLFNNLGNYNYIDGGIAIKDAFSQLLITEDTLEDENIRNKAEDCYIRFVENFYNDILGYQNGLSNKNITSNMLDCYFVQTSEGYIPIGLYKEQRPTETSVMVQSYLSQCMSNIKKDRNRAIFDWQNDISTVSAGYNAIKDSKNPSLAKAIIGIIASIPVLAYAIFNLTALVFFGEERFVGSELGSYSLIISVCAILIAVAVVAVSNSIKELLLIREKKGIEPILNSIHADAALIEKGTADFLENNIEQCFEAARKGENVTVSKNQNAVLIRNVKSRLKRALEFVEKSEKKRSAIGVKTFLVLIAVYLGVVIITFAKMPDDVPKNTSVEIDSSAVESTYEELEDTKEDSNALDVNYLDVYTVEDIISYMDTDYPRGTALQTPLFNTYHDREFGYRIDYPTHFFEDTSYNGTARKTYVSYDGSAMMKICAGYNKGGITSTRLCDELISMYDGEVTYNPVKDTWFAISIDDDDDYHYAYYKFQDGIIRGFEFHFKGAENLSTYSKYIDHIYKSFEAE